jgi:hypothetical protein
VHFLQDGWESYKEPLDCRFEQQPNEYIAAFGVGYVMGFSRALAGLTLVEAAISLRLDASEVSLVSQELASLQLVWCTYDPAQDMEEPCA